MIQLYPRSIPGGLAMFKKIECHSGKHTWSTWAYNKRTNEKLQRIKKDMFQVRWLT